MSVKEKLEEIGATVIDMSEPDAAQQLADAIGVKPGDTLNVMTPQFTRTDGRIPVTPDGWPGFFARLPGLALDEIIALGCRMWDDDIALFPFEWFDYIPEGMDVVNLNGATIKFSRTECSKDRRFGMLPYGFRIGIDALRAQLKKVNRQYDQVYGELTALKESMGDSTVGCTVCGGKGYVPSKETPSGNVVCLACPSKLQAIAAALGAFYGAANSMYTQNAQVQPWLAIARKHSATLALLDSLPLYHAAVGNKYVHVMPGELQVNFGVNAVDETQGNLTITDPELGTTVILDVTVRPGDRRLLSALFGDGFMWQNATVVAPEGGRQ